MVKRCSYGVCKSDDRYPERLIGGVKFVPFPKPRTNYAKCLRWIKLCSRPHSQLNPSRINSNKYVCTKHFHNHVWPTEDFPDPIPADPLSKFRQRPVRRPPNHRQARRLNTYCEEPTLKDVDTENQLPHDVSVEEETHSSTATQTHSNWIEPMEFLSVVVENETLKRHLSKSSLERVAIIRELKELKANCVQLRMSAASVKPVNLSIESIIEDKKLILYYTGFAKETFEAIYKFLIPNDSLCPFTYIGRGDRYQCSSLSLKNQLFLTICKLRNNFDLQDLGFRFGVTQQVASLIFNSWITYMFLRFGEICIWPHRDVLTEHMPSNYKEEFPTTFAIVDCTEIKIQRPSSLRSQSQTYSDYKSCNTLKALVAVDPRGSVIFSSMLFSGAMSDKEIFKQSGFQTTVKQLIEIGYLKEGDGLMGDKGFDITKEVAESGLKLNIPPFAKSGQQMNAQDVALTHKIAKHRVHVERAIRRIKSFKILSGRIVLSLMSSINQIWYVCSILTNFMPPCIKEN